MQLTRFYVRFLHKLSNCQSLTYENKLREVLSRFRIFVPSNSVRSNVGAIKGMKDEKNRFAVNYMTKISSFNVNITPTDENSHVEFNHSNSETIPDSNIR